MTISQLHFLVGWVCNQCPNGAKEGWFNADYDFNEPCDLVVAWYTWEKKELCFKPREIFGVICCFFHRKEKLTAKEVLFRLNTMKIFTEKGNQK